MKKILTYIILLIPLTILNAQILIRTKVKSAFIDANSQVFYNSINSYNKVRKNLILSNVPITTSIRDVISSQYNELVTVNASLTSRSIAIKNFISGIHFNNKLGYCSYGYIQEKYPLINPLSPSSVLKNQIIRLRFYKKFNDESKRIDDYLNRSNPIPEGERILLMLTSLENVINISLENETY